MREWMKMNDGTRAEAACSAQKPCGLKRESASADFHELRQGFIPPETRGAKAACSVRGSPAGWRNESASADFHELRQGFIPH